MKLKTKNFKELLVELSACPIARHWAGDMTIEEVVEKCHRGDWLLWLAKKVNVDLQKLTLAKGLCAKTVYPLMRDERSRNAVDIAICFGEGKATIIELNAADAAAAAAYAYAAAADAAYAAAYTAADAAAAAAYAAAAAAAYAAAADAAAADADAYTADAYTAALFKNQKETASICRKYIGNDIIQKVNELLT